MLIILKRELQSYFHTTGMYIFLAVFLALSSAFFIIGNLAARSGDVLSFLSNMSYLWMLLTPVLTMRLLSSNHTGGDQLLFSSSMSLGKIVLGKYLSALCVLCMSIVLSLLYPLIISVTGTLYIGETFAGYLGFFLLGAAFLAIDLWIASLTLTPIAALVAAFGANLMIWLYDILMKAVNIPFLTNTAEFLSLYRRLAPFLSGRIGLGDLVFDVSFAALMLFFCTRTLEIRRWKGGL